MTGDPTVKLVPFIAITAALAAGAAHARDQIQIVGSSTVFPYTQAVAEEFSRSQGFASPGVESTGPAAA
jgi:phosphate transport system substrate-binding protein